MSIDVGSRLRFVRERQGLSQRELAKLTGVTNSTISLIEASRMNPSIGALKRILDGIPIGLSEFFAIEPNAPSRVFYAAGELTEIGKGPISYLQVGESRFGRSLQILSETYEPGADTGRVPLTHDGQLDLTDLGALLDGAKVFSFTAMSNVLGTITPVKLLCDAAHAAGADSGRDYSPLSGLLQGVATARFLGGPSR